jgi:hypothetical protein
MIAPGCPGRLLIVIVTFEDVAVVVAKHDAFEVITTEITSLLFNEEDEYVAELVPTLLPFNFH